MKNVIYKITNTVNSKVYIGLTTQGMLQRKREHFSRANSSDRNHKLYLAIRKYGWESFEFTELFICFDECSLKEMECYFIKEYNSYSRGYNMTVGGDCVSLETRDKLSNIFTGRKITWYDKILESRSKNLDDRRQKYHLLLTNSGVYFEVWNITAFCKQHKMHVKNLYQTKATKFYKGYMYIESSTTSHFGVGDSVSEVVGRV